MQLFPTRDDLEAHYRASHTMCPQCANPLVFMYKEELREHCLREHFGCRWCKTATYSEDEESLDNHIRLDHFSCHLYNYQTVFTWQEDLRAHRRTAHGSFDCSFCYPEQPRIIWPAPWRKHMEQCFYPNPCTDDLHSCIDDVHSETIPMIDHCDLCKKMFEPQSRKVHLLFSHSCQDCALYEIILRCIETIIFENTSWRAPIMVHNGRKKNMTNQRARAQMDENNGSERPCWTRVYGKASDKSIRNGRKNSNEEPTSDKSMRSCRNNGNERASRRSGHVHGNTFRDNAKISSRHERTSRVHHHHLLSLLLLHLLLQLKAKRSSTAGHLYNLEELAA